jgi:ribonuclease VapC
MKVFDASALLAALGAEPGADKVHALLEAGEAIASSVNFAEVLTKLIDRGLSPEMALEAWRGLNVQVEAVDDTLAAVAAGLRTATRPLGLSLGDRCCLALAQQRGNAHVVTADRAWKTIKGFHFTMIR